MAESHIISALIAKHSEIQGQIKSHQESIDALKTKLESISKTIKIFEPSYDLRTITPKIHRLKLFKNGELKQLVIEFLKSNPNSPISAITEHIVCLKSISDEFRKSVYGGIYTILESLFSRGIINHEIIDGTKTYKIVSRS